MPFPIQYHILCLFDLWYYNIILIHFIVWLFSGFFFILFYTNKYQSTSTLHPSRVPLLSQLPVTLNPSSSRHTIYADHVKLLQNGARNGTGSKQHGQMWVTRPGWGGLLQLPLHEVLSGRRGGLRTVILQTSRLSTESLRLLELCWHCPGQDRLQDTFIEGELSSNHSTPGTWWVHSMGTTPVRDWIKL